MCRSRTTTNALILPGFVDTHVHYPQLQMIAAYGEQLLAWLDNYIFPAEAQFADEAMRSGSRTVLRASCCAPAPPRRRSTAPSIPQSVDAFFAESERFNTRMVAGKVLMDRNAPAALLDTAQRGYDESKALIARWHGRGRQHYCVTPRFAPTSTEAQLDAAGALLREHDGLFLQTAPVREPRPRSPGCRTLFPDAGELPRRLRPCGARRPALASSATAIHMGEEDFCTCHATGAALAHCPTSNLFLGSGLFRLFDALDPRRPVRVGLGTDVGAGHQPVASS